MFSQIFVNQIRSMCGQTVVVQNPISCLPQLQVFPVDSVSKAAKNIPVHCLAHSVAQWNVLFKEDFQHHLALWSVSTESLFLWRSWALSVWWLPLSLWVIKVTPHFIACDYSLQNVQTRVHHVNEITTDCGSFVQLVSGEIFWNHAATHMTHVQITMNSLQQVPRYISTFSATAFPWHRRWCYHFMQ